MKGVYRSGLLVTLVVVLAWSLVAFGPVNHTPGNSIRERDTTAAITDPGAHIGEKVVVSGRVVGTNPVRVRASASGVEELTLTGVDGTRLSTGDQLYSFGTLTGAETVEVERVNVVKPWETRYVYVASSFGVLIVCVRLVRDWRLELSELAFIPKNEDTERGSEDD